MMNLEDTAEQRTCEPTRKAFWDLGGKDGWPLVGAAGTITSLAAIAQKNTIYDPHRIQNCSLGLGSAKEIEHRVVSRTHQQLVG